MNYIQNFFHDYHWLVKVLAAILCGVLVNAAEYLLYIYYLPRAEKRHKIWRKLLIQAIHQPLIYFIWLFVISVIIETLLPTNNVILQFLSPGRHVLVLLFLFWFSMRFIRRWENVLAVRMENGELQIFQDSTSIHALAQISRILIILLIALMLMHSVGISISALLAFGGLGSLAFSFAAKDALANFIGGLMIYWDRPFSVGDWIRSPDRNIEGTVMKIGWRLTTVRTFDKRPMYVPNGVFLSISVENPSRMLNRRIKTLIGIRYEDAGKIEKIVKDISEMITTHPEIDPMQTMFVRLVEFGGSSLNIQIYAFTKTTEWVKFQEVQENVFLKIIAIIAENNAEFAYPTSTVHVPNGIECFQSLSEEDEVSDDSRNLQ